MSLDLVIGSSTQLLTAEVICPTDIYVDKIFQLYDSENFAGVLFVCHGSERGSGLAGPVKSPNSKKIEGGDNGPFNDIAVDIDDNTNCITSIIKVFNQDKPKIVGFQLGFSENYGCVKYIKIKRSEIKQEVPSTLTTATNATAAATGNAPAPRHATTTSVMSTLSKASAATKLVTSVDSSSKRTKVNMIVLLIIVFMFVF